MPSPQLCDTCFVTEPVVLDKPATDFTAEGYFRGQRVEIRLSDVLNNKNWVVLFFYSNDFTFV